MTFLELIGRSAPLFQTDLAKHDEQLRGLISGARCLVIGGAGSIGRAVVREIFRRNPEALHVVDISENNLVELVRDLRSTLGYIKGDFRTFAIDCGGLEFEALVRAEGPYDYVFNLSALKHVRSEKDPFTLMRMVQTNIFYTVKALRLTKGAQKYFCVSTDKAAAPVNMMGASKRIMELFLMRESLVQPVSSARFANVAFSDGSLLDGFRKRIAKRQPIAAPSDVRRFFMTEPEAGELCLFSALLGENRDIFFPKPTPEMPAVPVADVARRFIRACGYEPYECATEEEARARAKELINKGLWPCYFAPADTTGEKEVEEFFTGDEDLDMQRFASIGVIRNPPEFNEDALNGFEEGIKELRDRGWWTKEELLRLFKLVLPEFAHKETGKYLDEKM
ncbi:MAG: NAD-dependent epimerase/dehydratase family protein [Zetaproteobacteria bacterium]|nr:MAG: NAD-dependent epimerase/dehydratase family protein [Zetaproteobacteria bacterium]